jgi:glycosyltransferase involved in cell wall biosynthesis
MKILFIGGVFAKENEAEIISKTKTTVEYSANLFQKKLILGFIQNRDDIHVISAPFIGSYPNAYHDMIFSGFLQKQNDYEYVKFNNVWGLRNLSRAHSLKKAVKSMMAGFAGEKVLVVVYSPHTPFLEAAVYAKKCNSFARTCLIVPDLPQYMNLNTHRSALYNISKKFDIQKINSLVKKMDSFMLLTEPMKEMLPIGDLPYFVAEGIVETQVIGVNDEPKYESAVKTIVYAGKMNEKFGVKNLVDAFQQINTPNVNLILCGAGDALAYVQAAGEKDNRIRCIGQLPQSEAMGWIKKADVLVNPRTDNEEYTKYSFPSKNIDYLLSGKPVVAYMLKGMPEIYRSFLFVPSDESLEALRDALTEALNDVTAAKDKADRSYAYLCKELTAQHIAERIVAL